MFWKIIQNSRTYFSTMKIQYQNKDCNSLSCQAGIVRLLSFSRRSGPIGTEGTDAKDNAIICLKNASLQILQTSILKFWLDEIAQRLQVNLHVDGVILFSVSGTVGLASVNFFCSLSTVLRGLGSVVETSDSRPY